MRNPTVENKYNLKVKDIKKYKLKESVDYKSFGMWRNDIIDAWCISGDFNPFPKDDYGTYATSYWVGFYDNDARVYKGKTRELFTSYGGMCKYNFNEFYCKDDIENEADLKIQEMFLDRFNYLIDNKVIELKKEK